MNQQIAIGVAIGVGCALLVPMIGLAVAAGGARPVGRALARTGSVIGEKTRETIAELGEVYEDFVAEARADRERPETESRIIQTPDESSSGPESPPQPA